MFKPAKSVLHALKLLYHVHNRPQWLHCRHVKYHDMLTFLYNHILQVFMWVDSISFEIYCICDRFDGKKDVAALSRAKTSVIRAIKRNIIEQYPTMKELIEELLPKKGNLSIARWWMDNVILGDRNENGCIRAWSELFSLNLTFFLIGLFYSPNRVQLVCNDGVPLFFNTRDGPHS